MMDSTSTKDKIAFLSNEIGCAFFDYLKIRDFANAATCITALKAIESRDADKIHHSLDGWIPEPNCKISEMLEKHVASLSGASQAKPLPGNAPSQGEDA